MRIRTADANRARLDVTGCGTSRKNDAAGKRIHVAKPVWQFHGQQLVPPWQNAEGSSERSVNDGGFGQEGGGASTRSIVASSRWVSTGFSKNAVAPS